MRCPFRAAAALCLVTVAACSPVFNWREVPIEGAELVALLPCRPQREVRVLPLDAQPVEVGMTHCKAGGATFAIVRMGAGSAAQAERWLAAWRAQVRAQWQGARIDEQPARVAHAAAVPAPWQLRAEGVASAARPARMRALGFAHAQRDGVVSVYQATVFGEPLAPQVEENFFEGLRLP